MNGFMNKVVYIFIFFTLLLLGCKKEVPSISTMNVEGGEEVQFEAALTYSNANYYWEFGDGAVSTQQNPTHTYLTPGAHVVTLSIYKGGKLREKYTQHIVKVEQLYVPRIDSCNFETDDHDYLFAGLESYLRMYVSEEINNSSDYRYEVYVNQNLIGDSKFSIHTFSDSGDYQIQFKLFDKNDVSGTLDTTVHVGFENSYLSMNLSDANLSSLGTITEQHLLIYRNKNWEYSSDYSDFLDYPGPTSGALISGNQLMDYYGPGVNDYFYWSFDPLYHQTLTSISDGASFNIEIPAYDDWNDFDDLKIYLLIVGTNGINISDSEVQITPGTVVPAFNLQTPNFFSY